MEKTDGTANEGKAEVEEYLQNVERYLADLWNKLREHLRDPKFLVEVLALVGLGTYTYFTIRMYSANKQSADAATSAAKTAEQTMRLDQRAWIAVTAINSKQPPQINQKFAYSVHFIDTGKTPASNVVVYPGDELIDKGQKPNFSISTPVRLGVLSPGSERTYENGPVPATRKISTMTGGDLAVLRTKTLSIHGKITYDDIFGCHHWITYCASLKDDWSGYVFCAENNDTDPVDQPCHRKTE
jgi:hypothetical protein